MVGKKLEILKRAVDLKPIIKLRQKSFPFLSSFWIIEPYDLGKIFVPKKCVSICKAPKLYKLATVDTFYQECGYDGEFQPVLEEVLAEIPQELVDQADFYNISFSMFDNKEYNGFYVKGKTTLYKAEEDVSNIKHQPIIFDSKIYTPEEIVELDK